jgi:hypothetical protein
MNSRKISLALATVITILSGTVLPSNAQSSPRKGVVCPKGYDGRSTENVVFRCSKQVTVLIENICTNPQFPKLNLRVGKDLCSKNNATIAATGALDGLNEGRDFVKSVPDPDAIKKAEERLEQGFASGRLALPPLVTKRPAVTLSRDIPAGQREAVVITKRIAVDDAGDIDDHTNVFFDVFVLPVNNIR